MIGKRLAWSARVKREDAFISQLQNPVSGELITDKTAVSQAFLQHYKALYESKYGSIYLNSFRQLGYRSCHSESLISTILGTEVQEVLATMPSGKVCGNNGFLDELFKVFASELVPFLTELCNFVKDERGSPDSFKESTVVSFVKKEKNPKDVNFYRPISLLNTDYKLLMKLWARLISPAAPALILHDQMGLWWVV
ncbi:hypothetical protein NDU88_002728 [Pleurodeles waltl]|uniref:Uncharacterized protein n=1 Tax=Pleurodeles waltl TaxID=8319 RepID=A0AAV7PA73_PLEWA|nr:hypothetical protein NDU88_002728 [Pleurodeles waltl]